MNMVYQMNVDALIKRWRLARGTLFAFIATSILLAFTEALQALGAVTLDERERPSLLIGAGLIYLFYAVAFFVSVVAVARWIYRAHANLAAADVEGLEFTPGWAVGWFFVPVMNLFKPYQAMRSLWHNSFGTADQFSAPAPDVLRLWWGTWIIGNMLANLSFRMESVSAETSLYVGLPSTMLLIAAAWFLLNVMQEVTAAQAGGPVVTHVFA